MFVCAVICLTGKYYKPKCEGPLKSLSSFFLLSGIYFCRVFFHLKYYNLDLKCDHLTVSEVTSTTQIINYKKENQFLKRELYRITSKIGHQADAIFYYVYIIGRNRPDTLLFIYFVKLRNILSCEDHFV